MKCLWCERQLANGTHYTWTVIALVVIASNSEFGCPFVTLHSHRDRAHHNGEENWKKQKKTKNRENNSTIKHSQFQLCIYRLRCSYSPPPFLCSSISIAIFWCSFIPLPQLLSRAIFLNGFTVSGTFRRKPNRRLLLPNIEYPVSMTSCCARRRMNHGKFVILAKHATASKMLKRDYDEPKGFSFSLSPYLSLTHVLLLPENCGKSNKVSSSWKSRRQL